MNIFVIYEGGVISSERDHHKIVKEKIGASLVFYLNPIVFLKDFLANFKNNSESCFNPLQNFLLSSLLSFIFLISILFTLPIFLITSAIFPWEKYIYFFKNLNLYKIYVGDSLLSSVMRSRFSGAAAEKTFRFIIILGLYTTFLLITFTFSFIIIKFSSVLGGKMFHWVTDAIYINNAFRRLLSHSNSVEARYERNKYQFNNLYKSCRDLELANNYINADQEVKYDQEGYRKATVLINGIINRTEYSHLLTREAFTKNIKVDSSNKYNIVDKKSVVLFMHRFADAQYGFGVDEFLDINEWQNETIDLCIELGLNVFIRPHPEMLIKTKFQFPSELRYIDKLRVKHSINLELLNDEPVVGTLNKQVFFLSPFMNLKDMKDMFGMYLCITHHGSVAVESAYLGHRVIASTASPYDAVTDNFIDFYSTKEKYAELLGDWAREPKSAGEETVKSVLNFVLRNNQRFELP